MPSLKIPDNIITLLDSTSGKNIKIAQELEQLKRSGYLTQYKVWEYAIIIRKDSTKGFYVKPNGPSDDPERVICKG